VTIKVIHQPLTDGTVKLKVVSPYHPSFPTVARTLGGKWSPASKAWYFDLRDETRVRKTLVEIYGTDGTPTPTVDVRMVIEQAYGADLWAFGRQIMYRASRDAQIRLGEGVILIEGNLPSWGGSAKHPSLDIERAASNDSVPEAFRKAFDE